MPYFITDKSPDCAGWATIKEDGEVIGCHSTKQAAIDQMVAVSIAEDMEPGGERNGIYDMEEPEEHAESHDESEESEESDESGLPSNYRPASSADVPANHNCGNCGYYKNFWCKRWDALVSPSYYCNAWEPVKGIPNDNPGQTVQTGNVSDEDPNYFTDYPNVYDRQLSFDVPVYIRAAARKGLDYYGKGLAGDGLVARTVREARDMAAGRISEDKVVRANAWGARHLVDLDAPKNSDASNDQFPGPGAVAFYLWGINPLNPEPAMNWFARQAERVQAERADAPAPAKDQIQGSEKNPEGSAAGAAGSSTIELTEAIESGLSNKVAEHNDNLEAGSPSWKRATVGMLRAVYRRGAGAYSTSHRPGVSRNAWAMARVNAFLVLLRSGRPANSAYIGDNDLLPKGHPRSSRN